MKRKQERNKLLRGAIMKILAEIKNQTKQEALSILSAFVKEYGREDFGADKRSLEWLFNQASEKADYVEPYAVEDNFKLYEVEVEYFGNLDGKNGHPAYITVYIADYLNEDTGDCQTYYAL